MSKRIKEKQRKINNSLKLLVKTSFIVFIGVILSKFFTYLYKIVIARSFGSEVYGLFSLSIIIISMIIAFSSLGLPEGITRFISFYRARKDIKRIKYLIKISLIGSLVSSIIVASTLFIFSEKISVNIFHNSDLIIFLKILSLTVPLVIISNIFLSTMRGFEKIKTYSILVNIVNSGLKLFFLLLLLFFGFKINSVYYSYFLASVVMVILSFIFFKFYIYPEIFNSNTPINLSNLKRLNLNKKLFFYSWPIMFTGTVASLFYWSDTFIIGYFMQAKDIGLYNTALPIVAILGIVPDLFMQLFFPMITKEISKKNKEIVSQISKQVGKWIIILNIPIFLIMILFPGVIINLLFGAEYIPIKDVLRILAIGSMVGSFSALPISILSSIGKTKLILFNLLSLAILNIILNFILIPKYGLTGAAIATTISFFIFAIILLIEVYHFTKIIPFRRKTIRIILVSLIPLLIIFFTKDYFSSNLSYVLLTAILFVLLYSFLILIFRCLDDNDWMIINRVKTKSSNIINNIRDNLFYTND